MKFRPRTEGKTEKRTGPLANTVRHSKKVNNNEN